MIHILNYLIFFLMFSKLKESVIHTRLEIFTVVIISMLAFGVVTPCGLEGRIQRFGGTNSLRVMQRFRGRCCRYHQGDEDTAWGM